ncbi:Inner membrane transport protein YdhP [Streptomyces sp. RB5]|uniref:Inner membrane transport protein YdhP n=1 Tax=Streptomyces smaragdinus TaxID=2585196 RepID=A0A7K0CHY0_9ACTN|nr:Cmx/CmrA family chloramphenicol efflux MFS transporter [Streptomyces smaragdinus]MQY13036.1 Inner membrane transport protein YdhP [Streptomyces smaragdinus]
MPASRPAAKARVPFAVYVLGLSVFALGTSEFMLSGLLPEVADDLNVSIPRAGLLISAFAIGMVVGAPVLAGATLRLPRRTTLVGLLIVFGAGHVVGALADSYALLFATRVVSALACAGFWAVGAAVAVSMVPAGARAKAMAIMIGGLSVANVVGVPGGAVLGQAWGWRSAFWAVSVMTAVAVAGVLALVPRVPVPKEPPRLRQELRIYANPQVWLVLGTIALFAGSTFSFFSYLSPLLQDVSGLSESWVPTVLGLFGVGAIIGTVIGGRIADANIFATMYVGLSSVAVTLVLIALLAEHAVAVVILTGLLGVVAFMSAPALNARMFDVAHDAQTLAGATNTSSFNIGNTVGPWLGGLVISAGLGYPATAWTGAAMAGLGVAGVALQARHGRGRVVARSVVAQSSVAEASRSSSV